MSNYWKNKKHTFTAMSRFLAQVSKRVFPALIKMYVHKSAH